MKVDNLMEIMRHPERRSVVYVMDELEAEEFQTDEITREIRDRDYFGLGESQNFEVALHHNYLPTLEDSGVIDHDPETGKISYHPDSTFEEQIEDLRELEQQYGGESFIGQSTY